MTTDSLDITRASLLGSDGTRSDQLRAQTQTFSAHNYKPLPVVIAEAEGCWVTDVEGRRYLDMLAAYSAINFGHRHPRLVEAAHRQLDRVTLVSRAFDHEHFGPFCAELAELAGMEMVLPMNTGAEAVETAIKVARKWGYEVKGVPADQAVIVAFGGNFHGRTTTIISFSTDEDARTGFGPYTPGFRIVGYGDLDALAATAAELGDRLVAVLVEPVQGEAGVIVPPPGFLAGVRRICSSHGALMIADEIQSGLGRTGTTFACEHENVVPDAYLLGKALGGGIVPVSAMVSRRDILGVLRPGQHGSTFGGNPLACAVAREVIAMLRTGEFQQRSRELGARMHARLSELPPDLVRAVHGRGLWAGVEFTSLPGRAACERLAAHGLLAKDTHGTAIRLAPPLVITDAELDWAMARFEDALPRLVRGHAHIFRPTAPGELAGGEAAVAAVVVDQRTGDVRAVRGSGHRQDLPDHDAVVAALVHRVRPAFERRQRIVEDGGAGDRARMMRVLIQLAPERTAPDGQPAGGLLGVLAEHRHGPGARGEDRVVEARGLLHAGQDEQRLQRYGGERVHRHRVGDALRGGRDDHDAGSELPGGTPEGVRVRIRHRSGFGRGMPRIQSRNAAATPMVALNAPP